jgi:aldose 1-epimerase
MSILTLDNHELRLAVDPEQGVEILTFSAFHHNRWLPIMPDVQSGQSDLKQSSFLMLPYSNRIEHGRFPFAGQEHQLAHGDRHSIHGDVRTRPWLVDAQSDHRVRCTFDSRQHEAVNWPWPFTATAEYALDGLTLIARLTMTNQGESPMPAGFGWHPYYSRSLTREGEPVQLHFGVQGVYPDANNNRIPSGPGQPPAPHQDFRTQRTLAPDQFLDLCCYGYDGDGTITWPESGVQVRYRCSPECTHLVLYNPPKPYFAAEPVTNANNGVNLLAQGDPTSGVQVLQPGATLAATFETIIELS